MYYDHQLNKKDSFLTHRLLYSLIFLFEFILYFVIRVAPLQALIQGFRLFKLAVTIFYMQSGFSVI